MSAFLTGFWVAVTLMEAAAGTARATWGAVGMTSICALGWALRKREPSKGCKP